ncbi:MAG: hypothetical protein JW709_06740, partial [Sedimentisphaerales bacterium]|nr:hypothetical protein [Sedimentisphaerales bacterium]
WGQNALQPPVKPEVTSPSLTLAASEVKSLPAEKPAQKEADKVVGNNFTPPSTSSLSDQRQWAIRRRFTANNEQSVKVAPEEQNQSKIAQQVQEPIASPAPVASITPVSKPAISRSVSVLQPRRNITSSRNSVYQPVQYSPYSTRSQRSDNGRMNNAFSNRNAGYSNRSSGVRQDRRMSGQTGQGGYSGRGYGSYGEREYRAQRLIGIIQTTIAPDSWADINLNTDIQRNRR